MRGRQANDYIFVNGALLLVANAVKLSFVLGQFFFVKPEVQIQNLNGHIQPRRHSCTLHRRS